MDAECVPPLVFGGRLLELDVVSESKVGKAHEIITVRAVLLPDMGYQTASQSHVHGGVSQPQKFIPNK
jgi:hypothetical protein